MKRRRWLISVAILAAAACSEGSVEGQGPIAWFSFDAPASPGTDVAGSHDAIAVVGVNQVPGPVGLAGEFVFGYMQLAEAADLALLAGDFTLSLFLNSDDRSNRNWFTKATTADHKYGVSNVPTGQVGLSFNGNAAFGLALSTSVALDGQWHHIAGVKRGLIAEIWVDGVLEDTDAIDTGFVDAGAFAVGRDGPCCEFFHGLMDEVKIWPRALSAAEIAVEAQPDSPCEGSQAPPCTVTLLAARDSFLRQGAPNTNEGAHHGLRLQSSGKNRVLAGFDLEGISLQGLVQASLVLTISELADNWGASGRGVSAHRLLTSWTEGNGSSAPGGQRGEGPGVTWSCGSDAEISNQQADCTSAWNGGSFAPPSGPTVLHFNGLMGEVAWEVTADVLAGAAQGWILIKDQENQNGKVVYHSREGAALGDPDLGPRLVLAYE